MSKFEVEIYRKNLKWVASLNGGIVAKGFTLKGVERRVKICTLLASLRAGKGTL